MPAAAGVKVTEIEQLALTAKLAPQLVVSAKSPEFVPPIMMVLMVSGAVPLLVSVTVWAAADRPSAVAGKVRLAGDTPAVGTPTPVPARDAVCVEPETFPALSVTVRVAVRLPAALGVNVTAIVQLPPAATLLAQVFVSAKSLELAPLMVMLAMVRAAVPELMTVTVWAALVALRFVLPKVTVVGERAAAGTPAPVPVNAAV